MKCVPWKGHRYHAVEDRGRSSQFSWRNLRRPVGEDELGKLGSQGPSNQQWVEGQGNSMRCAPSSFWDALPLSVQTSVITSSHVPTPILSNQSQVLSKNLFLVHNLLFLNSIRVVCPIYLTIFCIVLYFNGIRKQRNRVSLFKDCHITLLLNSYWSKSVIVHGTVLVKVLTELSGFWIIRY